MSSLARSSSAHIPPRRLIGVLGGMGPAATVDFLAKIVAATPATSDQEHVPLIVHSVPQIPDRSASIQIGSDAPFLPLLAGARLLESSGVDAIAMPCNTAHFWYDRLERACAVPILHIADAVVDPLRHHRAQGEQVALMATRGTIAAGVYERRLARHGVSLSIPPEEGQLLVDQAIHGVKSGNLSSARAAGEAAAEWLFQFGAQRLLLACTELPVAMAQTRFSSACIDATEALALACVQASFAPYQPEYSLAG